MMTAIRPRSAPPDSHRVTRLAVITSYFNVCGYQSTLRNYLRFAEALEEQGVPLFTAELAFGATPFTLPQSPHLHRFRSPHVLWHKERLLNLLLKRVPQEFDRIAWVDADILFQDPDWPEATIRALDSVAIVQLFDEVMLLDPDGTVAKTAVGLVHAFRDRHHAEFDFSRAHPGFAWAARRDLLEAHGLFDASICGGGDSLMACAMFGSWQYPMLGYYPPALRRRFVEWGQPFWREVQGRVGVVSGRVHHLWHGERTHRKYVERLGWLRDARFDPALHLQEDDQGLWAWRAGVGVLREQLGCYFFDRREDG
jgi:hypothetical protein